MKKLCQEAFESKQRQKEKAIDIEDTQVSYRERD
jgi:hypothetical protein